MTGSPVPVIEGSSSYFEVARNGTLVYLAGASTSAMRLVWVDREGRISPAVEERRAFSRPHLSPDGRRVAVEVGNPKDIWVYELERGTRTRVTSDAAVDQDPIWTPDGANIVFGSTRGGVANDLFSRSADGSGEASLVFASDVAKDPHSFSRDGRLLAYYERKTGGRDI
jgi:Tol biopolymer transport system component